MQEPLIKRLQQQDKAALSELYDAYGGALYGVALRIVQDEELAQQVLQDTFLKIWRNAGQYDPSKGRLFTWMLNIARNTAIDLTRTSPFRQARKTTTLDSIVHRPGGMSANPEHVGLRELVGNLEEKYRDLIELVYFQGYTQEEAAEQTGIPLGTVKTRLRHAIGELRKYFGDPTRQSAMLAALLIDLMSS